MASGYSYDNLTQRNTISSQFPSVAYNVNQSHPLIPSSQEYMNYKKYVSIHSEDRNMIKFPNASQFDIEMPEDMTNVSKIQLTNWTFPANYNTFSALNSNISMTFKINPTAPPPPTDNSSLATNIYNALQAHADENYLIVIEEGFYNPQQITVELTNKFNHVVTVYLEEYFESNGWVSELAELRASGGYTRFIVVYNSVSQKIWFGNMLDSFILTNDSQVVANTLAVPLFCGEKHQLPDYSNWGLPANLGLERTPATANNLPNASTSKVGDVVVPRFYYGDVFNGDIGYWLLPLYPDSPVFWVECIHKINLMGSAYFYMELTGQNCINETAPYNLNTTINQSNQTNGIVNSSFAKIAVPATPMSQWFDRESMPYKFYYPPAEKIRRLSIRLRYHNGELVNFGVFNFTFMLEFTLQMPMMARSSSFVN